MIDKDYTNESMEDISTNQFSGAMVIAVFSQIAIIIIDRLLYLSRNYIIIDQKRVKEKKETLKIQQIDINSEVMNKYSDSIGIKGKFKTQEIKGGSFQEQLNIPEQSEDSSYDKGLDDSSIEVQDILPESQDTGNYSQGMIKYYFQWIVLVFIHLIIFWYFPNHGNVQIQGHYY
jgi:hypothetical protein